MIWSFSGYRNFLKCPRQWFYKSGFANARAKDALRHEAYRLSKLEGIQAWRGKIVDRTISETIIPSIQWGRPCNPAEARITAQRMFQQQKAQRMNGFTNKTTTDKEGGFFELEYGLPLTEAMFDQAWIDIDQALQHFYQNELLWELLRSADRLIPQRPLSFTHGDVTVRVVPDLIVFRSHQAPIILDWKVNTRPLRDYWLQLVTGAIALTRCKPHKDWPAGAANVPVYDIQLLEVQLLTEDVRTHTLSEADVVEAEDFIAISAMEMQLSGADEVAVGRQPGDYPVAWEAWTCQYCLFRKMCWEVVA